MEKLEVGRKFSRTVPVIIETHENAAKKTKLMIPCNYTAGHLVNILRSRMHLLPYHPVYLFLKSKLNPVLMSKSIGYLHHKHQDERGQLRLIHAGQASFGFRGNIRAIRFRQKWIENHHNTLHQDAGGPPSYSGVPPPYFPLESPSTSNNEAQLDGLIDSNDLLLGNNILQMIENSLLNVAEDSLPTSDEQSSWQSSGTAESSQSSSLTNSSQSITPTVINSGTSIFPDWADPWLSSSLSDPWLPSATANSGQATGTVSSSLVSNNVEDNHDYYFHQIMANIYNAYSAANTSVPPYLTENDPSSDVPNSQAPPHDVAAIVIYESDSDFYDSDKDVDTDN